MARKQEKRRKSRGESEQAGALALAWRAETMKMVSFLKYFSAKDTKNL